MARAKLRDSTTVILVSNIEPTMEWYKQLRFASKYYPPGFALVAVFALCLAAHAQCPVDTIIVKGRVEHPIDKNDYRVRVQLIYPKHKPGESGEVTVEDANFQLPVEFVTEQSSIFTNLPKRCGRKPQTVDITLLSGDQKSDEVFLDFSKHFRMVDASAYALRSELVLNGGSQ